jgi:hypothetical protein
MTAGAELLQVAVLGAAVMSGTWDGRGPPDELEAPSIARLVSVHGFQVWCGEW